MLKSRIIPFLMLSNGGLVKTTQFSRPKYIGDPLNAVRIFNEKLVDELILVDIDATTSNTEPDFALIEKIASECQMPLCYGGGIKKIHQIEQLVGLGVEKVALGSAAINQPDLIQHASLRVGSQSIVAVMDVKLSRFRGRHCVYTHNGARQVSSSPEKLASQLESYGAGELLINSIDRDGMMCGYDLSLIQSIKNSVTLPITVLGGAGSTNHIKELTNRFGPIGAAAGSLFVFTGKHKAVLLQYPDPIEKQSLFYSL